MIYFIQFITNKFFLAPALGWFVAQASKVIIDVIKNKKLKAERLTGGGGMPSSHSATVVGLMVITGILKGLGSFEFVMALFFGIVVIYDALGVRLETQRQSVILNVIEEERIKDGKEPTLKKPLREQIGHTIPEIIVGVIIGIAAALVVAYALPF